MWFRRFLGSLWQMRNQFFFYFSFFLFLGVYLYWDLKLQVKIMKRILFGDVVTIWYYFLKKHKWPFLFLISPNMLYTKWVLSSLLACKLNHSLITLIFNYVLRLIEKFQVIIRSHHHRSQSRLPLRDKNNNVVCDFWSCKIIYKYIFIFSDTYQRLDSKKYSYKNSGWTASKLSYCANLHDFFKEVLKFYAKNKTVLIS